MLTILAFLGAISLLVFVHEYGHYWVAKRCGVGVSTFSIGFGKPLVQWQRGETTWQIAMIPMGGFVRMMDEAEAPVVDRHKAFNHKHPLQKMAVVVAGPLANLLFAVLAISLCYVVGVKTIKPEIASVQLDSIAAKAGLVSGDRVVSVNGETVDSWDQLQVALFDYAGEQQLELEVADSEGRIRVVQLAIGQLSAAQFDQQLLNRLGLSPFYVKPVLAHVQPEGAAAKAGLRPGDVILSINQRAVKDWVDVQSAVLASDGHQLAITVKRDTEQLTFSLSPKLEESNGAKVPRLGIAPKSDDVKNQSQQITISLSPISAFAMGVKKTYQMAVLTVRMFGKMLVGVLSPKQVSGPVGIAEYAGQSAALGWMAYVQFLALMSISLGVLNLLPVPILDGGHLLYHGYELVTGKTVPALMTEWLQKIGLTLLLMLMGLALFNDLSRIFLS